MLSGIIRTLDLPVTEDQMKMFENGVLIKTAFPNLSAVEQEFILTGISADEWIKWICKITKKEEAKDQLPEHEE